MVKRAICFFNSNRTWGGGEKWHLDVSIRFRDKGHPVCIVTNEKSELLRRAKKAGIPTHTMRISKMSILNPVKLLKISGFLKQERIDTIIVNLPSDLKAAGIAAKHAGVRNIIYRRGLAKPVKNRFLNRYLFRNIVTKIIVNSEETKKLFLMQNDRFVGEEKIRVIYNGIDLNRFDASPSIFSFPREPDEFILGSAGRFVKQKAQHLLIEIASRLKLKKMKFRMMIAGEGKLKEELERTARELGVEREVIFPGFIDDTKGFMESIDIFLLPSLWEGFGYAIVEAMACRKPVIAFNVSSNPEIIDDGRTGFLIEDMNVEKFLQKIELLIGDRELRRKLGEEGRKKVERDFSLDRVVREVEEMIS